MDTYQAENAIFLDMNHIEITQELERNQAAFKALLTGISKAETLWKPLPDKWCLLEIVCHLRDEEIEDFRARTRHVLETPSDPMPPINPSGWVQERSYITQDYSGVLARFINEREQSIQWLQSLSSPKWDNAYIHKTLGPMSANLFLNNWLAHDYLHIRQILNLKYAYLKQTTGETLEYAGGW